MSFRSAFHYPYKNLPKIATIVLVYTALLTIMVAMAINARSTDNTLLLTIGIVIAHFLFLTGYGMRVIRHVLNGYEESMPNIELLSDIGRGIVVIIAGILTLLPPIIFLMWLLSLIPMSTSTYSSSLVTLCILLAIIAYLCLGYVVGIARYAQTEYRSALFEFGTNFGYVNNNFATAIRYIFYVIVVTIIYTVCSLIVSTIYNDTIIASLNYRNDENVIIALIAVGYILSISFSLLHQFANFHLTAQFAEQIGISHQADSDEKMKY